MSKAEKIFDRIIGTLFALCLMALIVYGILYTAPPVRKVVKTNSDTIVIQCAHCGWLNKRSLMEFRDTSVCKK